MLFIYARGTKQKNFQWWYKGFLTIRKYTISVEKFKLYEITLLIVWWFYLFFAVNRKSMGNKMNNIKLKLMFLIPIFASTILLSKIGISEELQVEMLEMSYSPEILYS